MSIMRVSREALLMHSYVTVICCSGVLCSPHSPLSPVWLPRDGLGSRDTWREGCAPSTFGGTIWEEGRLVTRGAWHGNT